MEEIQPEREDETLPVAKEEREREGENEGQRRTRTRVGRERRGIGS